MKFLVYNITRSTKSEQNRGRKVEVESKYEGEYVFITDVRKNGGRCRGSLDFDQIWQL